MHHRFTALALLVIAAACGSDDPAAVDLTGTWAGTYTHPSYPGSLTLTIQSTDDAFDGEYLIRYQVGLDPVRNIGGDVSGTRPSPTAVAFTIDATDFTWDFVGQLTNASRIQGSWESLTSSGIHGTFDLERQ